MPRNLFPLLLALTAACGGTSPQFASDDGVDCADGACDAVCGDDVCSSSEDCSSCADDCGGCGPSCGDGWCDSPELCSTCADDCGVCPAACGDGACSAGESCTSCSNDCGSCAGSCGDGLCNRGESCSSCATDCGACAETCGDGACASAESCSSCAADCGACEVLFSGTVCNAVDRGFPTLAGAGREEALMEVAAMARNAFAGSWDPDASEAELYEVMTWVLNTLRQNGWVAFRALDPLSTTSSLNLEEDKVVGREPGAVWTYDLFTSWQNPGTPQALAFESRTPYETLDLLDCAGADRGVPTNTIFPDDGGGTDPGPIELSQQDRDNVLAAVTSVRNNHPEFFMAADRAVAYEMMTVVINEARARGTDAMRCLAHPDLPPTDPYRWCSDALVVGQPGRGITIDCYTSWPDPATPQVLITGTGTTGEMTADLNP